MILSYFWMFNCFLNLLQEILMLNIHILQKIEYKVPNGLFLSIFENPIYFE